MLHLILHILYYLLLAVIVGYVLIAYFPHWRYHPLGELVHNIGEAILRPIQRIIPPIRTGNGATLDISPAVCLIVAGLLMEALDIAIK